MSSSGSTAIKPEYHAWNTGSHPDGSDGRLSPHKRVEQLKGSESVDSLEVESSFESSLDDEELFHSPPGTHRSATSASAQDDGVRDARPHHHVRVDADLLEPHELTFELPNPPGVQSHSQRAGGGEGSMGSEDPSDISGLSAVLNATQTYSLNPHQQPQQAQQSRGQPKPSSREQASGAAARFSPNHESHVVDMGLYQNMTADQMRAEIRVMAAELAMARQEAEEKVSEGRSGQSGRCVWPRCALLRICRGLSPHSWRRFPRGVDAAGSCEVHALRGACDGAVMATQIQLTRLVISYHIVSYRSIPRMQVFLK